jgi:hypothetical protein
MASGQVHGVADHLNIDEPRVRQRRGSAQPPHILFSRTPTATTRPTKDPQHGWGQRDTHAVLEPSVSLDNYIWGGGLLGLRRRDCGKKFQFAQAAFRFRPDGSD